ncbi:MAG TPA: SPOR domain-containing protein [Methylomirabilota bacterium]|nr:SPOR domain-containing protein [Methylomirabilota bacterium]
MRYRHAWPGFLLLAALAVLLAGLLTWGEHFLSPGPTGGLSRLLQLWPASRGVREAPPTVPQTASASSAPSASAPAPAADRADEAPAQSESAPAGTPALAKADPAAAPAPGEASRAATHSAAPASARYALALGTFPIADDAERIEARLNQAGFSTVRFRQQAPSRLFSVLIPQVRTAEEAQAIVERLRLEGFTQAVVLAVRDELAVRVAQSLPLRTAVRTAEQLRSAGHDANVAAEASHAGQITLRHGNFATRQEAEAASREIARLGVANEVVQLR